MYSKGAIAAIVILGATLTGCATIFTGTHDDVHFTRSPKELRFW